jgi:hypothetical protein
MAAQAQGLYKGQLFQKSMAYAKQLVEKGEANAWYILSAKHGLLKPTETVEPYDETLSDADSEEKMTWAKSVLSSISTTIGDVTAEVFGGQDYWCPLVKANRARPDDIEIVPAFEGMAGNGKMMQWLDRQLDEEVYTEPTPTELRTQNSGDGAPPELDLSPLVREVAEDVAEVIDGDVLTRHLIMLGMPQTRKIADQVEKRLSTEVREEGATSRGEAIEIISDWLGELGYEVDLPEVSPVGTLNPSAAGDLLSRSEDDWMKEAMDAASVATLYVAYRVAADRQERWRREEIAQYIHDHHGAVTEEDFPEAVWSEVQGEIDRRLEGDLA